MQLESDARTITQIYPGRIPQIYEDKTKVQLVESNKILVSPVGLADINIQLWNGNLNDKAISTTLSFADAKELGETLIAIANAIASSQS